jgi:hypothetical protein
MPGSSDGWGRERSGAEDNGDGRVGAIMGGGGVDLAGEREEREGEGWRRTGRRRRRSGVAHLGAGDQCRGWRCPSLPPQRTARESCG